MAKKTESTAKRSLQPERLLENLEKGVVEPVYFFYASASSVSASEKGRKGLFNDYLLDQALEALRRICVGGNTQDFNYNVFIGPESGMDKVIAIAQTFPMMRPRRLIVVKDASEFRADDWRQAERYLGNPSPHTCLVFIGEQLPTKNKGGEAAKKLVSERCAGVPFTPFTRKNELGPHLDKELARRKLKFNRDAESLFLDLLGFDMSEIVGALDKLQLYIQDRGNILVEDVEQCIARTRAEEIWGLLDALGERRLSLALKHLGRYLENAKTDDEILLMGHLVRHVNDLLDIRCQLDAGSSQAQVVGKLGGNEWAARKKAAQAGGHSLAGLRDVLAALHDCDVAIRSSRVPHRAHFERFLMRACGALPLR